MPLISRPAVHGDSKPQSDRLFSNLVRSLGAAVVAYTDDHNDFDGQTYVSRQITGPPLREALSPRPRKAHNWRCPQHGER